MNSRISQHRIACDLKPGHLEAAYKPEHFADMQREADFLARNFGWESEIVQPHEMDRHINGGGYHGGIYDARGGHFHPLNYALGLAGAALKAGVAIFEHSPVQRIDGDRVFTEQGCAKAQSILLAADNWMGDIDRELGGYTVPIMNYNIATALLPDADLLLPSDAAIADSRFVLNYFRLSADQRLIFGGGE